MNISSKNFLYGNIYAVLDKWNILYITFLYIKLHAFKYKII